MSGVPQFHPRDFRRGLHHAALTDGEYRVAVEMCEHANIGQPEVWPSVPTLAEVCDMTTRGIQLALESLSAKGVIVCISRTKGGRGHTNHWQLNPQTPNDGSGFRGGQNPEQNSNKPRTKQQETLNPRSPEVVRRRKEGGGEPLGALPPPPSRYCARHPKGTDDPCGACKEARRKHETFQAEQVARSKPRNHDDAIHPETWQEWAATFDSVGGMSVERPTNYLDAKTWDRERAEWEEWNNDLRAAIKLCRRCDERGQYTDDEGLWWCEHEPAVPVVGDETVEAAPESDPGPWSLCPLCTACNHRPLITDRDIDRGLCDHCAPHIPQPDTATPERNNA